MRTLTLLVAVLTVFVAVHVAYAEEFRDELKVNDEGDELVVREARAAKGRGGRVKNGNKAKECRYNKSPWGECSLSSNQRTRTLTLKKGDSNSCEETRTESKKCKRMCRYTKGQWTECVAGTNQMERIDSLKQGSDSSCDPTQKKVKKCKVCKYERTSDWSECHSVTGVRTNVRKLIGGDGSVCAAEKTKTKPCRNDKGKDHCSFGAWSEWSKCENGSRVKTRPVLSGGARCERMNSKSKPCKTWSKMTFRIDA